MGILNAIRTPLRRKEATLTERAYNPNAYASVARAIIVNGAQQTIGELRSGYANGALRMLSQGGGIVSGDYSPEQVANAYKTGVTTFIGVNVRCGIDAEIPIRAVNVNDEPVDDSPAQAFIDNAPKFIWRLMASSLIWGAIYIRKVRNRHGYPTGLEILSPLDVTPDLDYSKGTVARYCVRRTVGMEYVKPADMIADLTFNPFSDVDGTSAVEVAKVRSDIETAIGRYGAMFFANSARPDLVITTDAEMDENQQKAARQSWEANFKGVLNSFRAAFLGGSKWEVKPIGYNPSDLAMVELSSQADMKILAVMRVAPILAGIGHASDPLSAQGTYEQARTQHIEFVAIPDVRQICNVLNEQWLHVDFKDSPMTWTLEPDTAAILSSAMGTSDRITTANTAVTGHFWTVNEAREHSGKEPLPFAIDMNPDWAISLYKEGIIKRSQAQVAIGFAPATISRTDPDGFVYDLDPRAKAAPAPASPFGMFGGQQTPPVQNIAPPAEQKQIAAPKSETVIDVVPAKRAASEACYVILSLANDPAIMAMQAELRGKYPDVEWSTPDSFHVTLVYSPQTADLNAVEQILPRSINEFSFDLGPISSFEGRDKKPIILTVDAPVELLALQSGLAASFETLGLELSDYSQPDAWRPHVTLGYMSPDLPMPESTRTITVSSATIVCLIEAGQSFQNIYVTRAKAEKTAQLHELGLWAKRIKSKGVATRFNAELLPGNIATWVRSSLAEEWNPASVFDAARAWVRTDQQQALGATPEEYRAFWEDYDSLQADIREAWLSDYMARAWDALKGNLSASLTDDQVRSALAQFHDELAQTWIGTPSEPGALYSLVVAGMVAGDKALDSGKTAKPVRAVSIGVSWDLMSKEAHDFVRQYAFSLIKSIDDTTVNLVRTAIQQGIELGQGLDKVAAELEGVFSDPARARLIASTESLRAYNVGAFKRWQNAGVTRARWRTVSDRHVCPICRRLNGLEADFNQGWSDNTTGNVYRELAHPGCRCPKQPILGVLS